MNSCCFVPFGPWRQEPTYDDEYKNFKLFNYSEVKSATQNFDRSNMIGKGGFGSVYKGKLKNGTPVAIKTLSANSKQGVQEFLTEIDVVADIKHPNLVHLIGCCVQGGNRILIYEYQENGSLDYLLQNSGPQSINLDWSRRSAICMDAARGLAFLHEELDPYIVHRDIKASNILLDENLVAKLADFGLAKFFPDNVTHVSTRVAGTIGYLAPEYAMLGQLTKKADVYSFGVLLLEIISGKSCQKSFYDGVPRFLLEWVWQLFKDGREIEAVDPELGCFPIEEVRRYIKVALYCTQSAAKRRPSMTQVIQMLSRKTRFLDVTLTAPGVIHDIDDVMSGASDPSTGKYSGMGTGFSGKRDSSSDACITVVDSVIEGSDLDPR